jgi:hypothetical protein
MNILKLTILFVLGGACEVLLASPLVANEENQAGIDFFEKKIRPVMIEHCYQCHSQAAQQAGKLKAGLLLDTRAGLRKGGESGPVLDTAKPADSLLLKAVRHESDLKMPPDGKLADREVAALAKWIQGGAAWPEGTWTPAHTNTAVWLDASFPDTVTRSGSAVSEWRDKSGKGRDASKSNANQQPAWNATGINGKGVLDFDGAADMNKRDFLSLANDKVFDNDSDFFLEVWFYPRSTDGGRHIIGRGGGNKSGWAPNDGHNWHLLMEKNCLYFQFASDKGFGEIKSTPVASNNWHYVTVRRTGNMTEMWWNGVFVGSSTAMPILPAIRDRIRIGGHTSKGSTGYFDGSIQMLVWIKGTVDEDLRQKISGYKAWDLGLVSILPASHAYKAAAPVYPEPTVPARSFTEKELAFWSLQPVGDPQPPRLKKGTGPIDAKHPSGRTGQLDLSPFSDIDRFVIAALRAANLKPAPPADRRVLIRRATFDLTGLPPTPEEVDAFVADESSDAFATLIDRLLASPHYGERWGRHWLDIVRYADTAGETADFPAPEAWRYRNYVIAAFNQDKPYDKFLTEQLAGDILAAKLPADAPAQRRAELIVATGYLAIARRFGFERGYESEHFLTIDDTIDTLGKSFLGLTIACARCHDHKYDPISTADYYALYGIFDSTRYPHPGMENEPKPADLVPLPTIDPATKSPRLAYAVIESKPHNARIHLRGNPKKLGEQVPRRMPTVFGGQPVSGSGSGRLELAVWLANPRHPLTARVMVNRIWQGHFGAGLVKTPNNFGTRGEPPTHPELLDYLARRFVAGKWSIKAMHRQIMLTDAYQRSAANDARHAEADPDNSLLWRFSRRRLSAEEIRDSLLAVSGELDRVAGGAHPFPPENQRNYKQHNPFVAVYDHSKRSVYLMTQRIKRHPFLALFDGADTNASTGSRFSTIVPTQALYFLNDGFVHHQAKALAVRLQALPDDAARLDRATRLLYGRAPTATEKAIAARFLSESAASKPEAWAGWLRVLFASNEFVYLD